VSELGAGTSHSTGFFRKNRRSRVWGEKPGNPVSENSLCYIETYIRKVASEGAGHASPGEKEAGELRNDGS